MGKVVRFSLGIVAVLSILIATMVIVGRMQPASTDVQVALQNNAATGLKVGDVITQLGTPMCFEQIDAVSRQPPVQETSYDLMFEHYIIIVDAPHAFSHVKEIIPVSTLYHYAGCYPTADDESRVWSWSWRGFRVYGDPTD